MWHLALRWRAAVDRAVGRLGLTHAQYSALASLRALTAAGEAPSQVRLAEYTGLGPIYISKLVRALEGNGLVARAPDPADARAVLLSLTERGEAVVAEAIPVVHGLNADLLVPIGGPDSPEAAALTATLRTLLAAAPPTDQPPGGPR